MLGSDDGKGKEHAARTGSSTVSPARFAKLEASVANLAALLRDSLAPGARHVYGAGFLRLTNIAAHQTSRILTEKRHWATLDKYRSLYCYVFYDAVAHAAPNEAAAAIEGSASQEIHLGAADIGVLKAAIAAYGATNQHRRDFLAYLLRLKAAGDADAGDKTLAKDYTRTAPPAPFHRLRGSPVGAGLREELQRQADYTVTAAAKADVNERFGGALTDDEPSPMPRRRPRRPPAPPEDAKHFKLKPSKPKPAKIDKSLGSRATS
eukprot:jgi/Tetstr1/460807/TSEL_000562.t1